jgi:DnaJ-class molecular chaperone
MNSSARCVGDKTKKGNLFEHNCVSLRLKREKMEKETCWKCHGRRFVVCSVCEGSGKGDTTAAHESERKVEGLRPTPCPNCNGTGSVKCTICKGTGYLIS